MILKYLIEKEFKQMARDPFILFIVIALPVLVMLVFPWATTMEIKNVNVAVVDNDRSRTSTWPWWTTTARTSPGC